MIVIGFQDDVVLPAHLGREVADAIPTAATWRFRHGHLGFIERPQVVNGAALKFFAERT